MIVTRADLKARCQVVLAARVPDSVLRGDALRCAQYRADAAVLARYVRSEGAVTTKAQMSLFRMEASISKSSAQQSAAEGVPLAGNAAARREAPPDGNYGDNLVSERQP